MQAADAPLAEGQVRVGIDHFALTSNNVTYAATATRELLAVFPVAPDADGTPWGCIPVWGFGVVLQPSKLSPASFSDGAPHRAALHAVYNQVQRCSADPFYTADSEAQQALLRPLFLTAWLIDDFLADNAFFGTTADGARGMMLLSSASSKKAYATAALLAKRPEVEGVGLTSPANVAFCESLGIHLSGAGPAVISAGA